MLIYRRALILAAAGVMAIGIPAAVQADQSGCATVAKGHSEWVTCLGVTVTVHGLPRVGEQAEVEIVLNASADRDNVDVAIELPAQLAWVQVPQGLGMRDSRSPAPEDRAGVLRLGAKRNVKANKPTVLSGRIVAVAEGNAHIRVNAATMAPEIASHSAFLTIGKSVTVAGLAYTVNDTAVPMTGGAPTRAYPQSPFKPAGTSTTPGSACATGSFGYTDTDGVNRIAGNVGVQIRNSANALLASGVTDGTGAFRLCYNTSQSAYAVFTVDNAHWTILAPMNQGTFQFRTETLANPSFGARMPGNPQLMRGVQAFDQVGAAWNWVTGVNCWDARDTTCRKAKITWGPDATDGTWYDLNKDSVYLLPDDPRSAPLVLHEFGHLIMDDVYEEAFPSSPKCNPHYIPRTSSRGCAWTEGFATLFEVMVLGEPVFEWADGRTLNVENPTWGTADWDNGDRVEGRVLGSLIDLYDSTNEGTWDRCTEDPRGPIWTTFLNHKSTTFAQYWSDRAADGFDTSRTAQACLYQNTVVYGGFRP